MTEKRFIYDGLHVRDTLNEIPPILTHNDNQKDKFLNGLNKLSEENKVLTEEKNYFERAYQEFIDFADKKAKELGYPSFCTDVINEIITEKDME